MGHGTNAVDILHLSESQNQEFLTLAKSHQQLMRELDGEKRELLKQYFATLNTKDEASSEALLSHIKEIEGQKTKKTFQHLEEVKSILNEDQKAIFPEFMDQVLQIILGNQHKNPAPPKDF
ncbi:hypothetical protein GCM10007049_37960 [Echinicola pacifica]|uniref:Uncharacterized protein n=2 Tax=Echinicola pacifica TaxID=346377 RepID=A0A918QC33_9BACT|nr:hypothetical protein GCM10007049_37960 [Echinicola pacifica]